MLSEPVDWDVPSLMVLSALSALSTSMCPSKIIAESGGAWVVKSSLWGECCCRLGPKPRCYKHMGWHPSLQLCSASTQPPWQSENPSLIQSHLHAHHCKAVNYQGLLLGVCSPWLALAMHHKPHSPPMPLPRALGLLQSLCWQLGGTKEAAHQHQRSLKTCQHESGTDLDVHSLLCLLLATEADQFFCFFPGWEGTDQSVGAVG